MVDEWQFAIAILDCVRDACRGAQLCAPTDRLFYPIENRYEASDRLGNF
ncbi:hypothetical protein IQ272_14060 [Chroococcidiopsidales cyanobacterium LEGE 13417]|nr:hypothetical protein [Chroococcidiopsidales cyanobacterium LEGE 13417]